MRVKSKIISDQKSLLDSGTFVVTSYVYFLCTTHYILKKYNVKKHKREEREEIRKIKKAKN